MEIPSLKENRLSKLRNVRAAIGLTAAGLVMTGCSSVEAKPGVEESPNPETSQSQTAHGPTNGSPESSKPSVTPDEQTEFEEVEEAPLGDEDNSEDSEQKAEKKAAKAAKKFEINDPSNSKLVEGFGESLELAINDAPRGFEAKYNPGTDSYEALENYAIDTAADTVKPLINALKSDLSEPSVDDFYDNFVIPAAKHNLMAKAQGADTDLEVEFENPTPELLPNGDSQIDSKIWLVNNGDSNENVDHMIGVEFSYQLAFRCETDTEGKTSWRLINVNTKKQKS